MFDMFVAVHEVQRNVRGDACSDTEGSRASERALLLHRACAALVAPCDVVAHSRALQLSIGKMHSDRPTQVESRRVP